MTSRAADLTSRAAASPWIAAHPGLADAVTAWEAEVGDERNHLVDLTEQLTRPGPPSPVRMVRHLTAVSLSRAIRIPTRLPTDLRDLTFVRDPNAWARQAGAEAFADQLALGGAATAEVARLIVTARRLFPQDLVDELTRRSINPPGLERDRVQALVAQVALAHPDAVDLAHVVGLGDRPVSSLPITQVHAAQLSGGDRALLRIRRPGVARQVVADARLSASMMSPLQQLLPQMGGLHPLGFVQLTTRLGLEAIDLRFEALNLVDLGLVVEDAGIDGLQVMRPRPAGVDERALLIENVSGVPLTRAHARPDPDAALRSLIGLTLEPALVHGVFWADPAPEHLLVTPDGGLALIGVGAAGHLSPDLRRAGIRFLTSVMSGDAEGQVEAMGMAGAVGADTDLDALVEDLRSAENLQVSRILMGGEEGMLAGLRDATRILLAHQIRPPLEVVMLLRTVFALGELADRVAPGGGGLLGGLMPLLQRLPELIAAAERHGDADG